MRSTERFLTTHTGSLPRPEALMRMMFAEQEGVAVEPNALASAIDEAAALMVDRQVAADTMSGHASGGIDRLFAADQHLLGIAAP